MPQVGFRHVRVWVLWLECSDFLAVLIIFKTGISIYGSVSGSLSAHIVDQVHVCPAYGVYTVCYPQGTFFSHSRSASNVGRLCMQVEYLKHTYAYIMNGHVL
jgi:hypothetical protein